MGRNLSSQHLGHSGAEEVISRYLSSEWRSECGQVLPPVGRNVIQFFFMIWKTAICTRMKRDDTLFLIVIIARPAVVPRLPNGPQWSVSTGIHAFGLILPQWSLGWTSDVDRDEIIKDTGASALVSLGSLALGEARDTLTPCPWDTQAAQWGGPWREKLRSQQKKPRSTAMRSRSPNPSQNFRQLQVKAAGPTSWL